MEKRQIMYLTIGKVYKVDHKRKGVFNLLVTEQDEDFVTGIITSGKANAVLKFNERDPGEEVCILKEFCTFKKLE